MVGFLALESGEFRLGNWGFWGGAVAYSQYEYLGPYVFVFFDILYFPFVLIEVASMSNNPFHYHFWIFLA